MRRLLLVLGIAGLLIGLLVIATGPLTDPGPGPGDPDAPGEVDVPGIGDSAEEAASGTGEIAGTVRRGQLPVAAHLELFRPGGG